MPRHQVTAYETRGFSQEGHERVGVVPDELAYDLADCIKASGKGETAMAASTSTVLAEEPCRNLISTGTPAGIGCAQKIKLQPGNRIRGETDGLGVLECRVEALQIENEVES